MLCWSLRINQMHRYPKSMSLSRSDSTKTALLFKMSQILKNKVHPFVNTKVVRSIVNE